MRYLLGWRTSPGFGLHGDDITVTVTLIGDPLQKSFRHVIEMTTRPEFAAR